MSEGMVWVVPKDPEAREFTTRDAALARAWELTPAGGQRAEPVEQMPLAERVQHRVPSQVKVKNDWTRLSSGNVRSSETPPPTPEYGDIWIRTDTADVYIWNGTGWVASIDPISTETKRGEAGVAVRSFLDKLGRERIGVEYRVPGDVTVEKTERALDGHIRRLLQKAAESREKIILPGTMVTNWVYDPTSVTTRMDGSAEVGDMPISRPELHEKAEALLRISESAVLTESAMKELEGLLKEGRLTR
jgi:ACT domain-containing protein